jgi:hypothetical protein
MIIMALISKIKGTDNIEYNLRDDVHTWGGRNLLLGTKNFTGGHIRPSERVQTITLLDETYMGCKILKREKILGNGHSAECPISWKAADLTNLVFPNKECTISYWAKGDLQISTNIWYSPYSSNAEIWANNNPVRTATASNGSSSWVYWNLTSDWRRYQIVLRNFEGLGDMLFCRIASDQPVGTTYIAGIKLEIGNKCTDWSPAPEDIAYVNGTCLELLS